MFVNNFLREGRKLDLQLRLQREVQRWSFTALLGIHWRRPWGLQVLEAGGLAGPHAQLLF